MDEKMKMPNGKFTHYLLVWNDTAKTHYSPFLDAVGTYFRGQKQGTWIYYTNKGSKAYLNTYHNGKLDGLYQSYTDNDQVVVEGNYRKDKREGEWHVYGPNGNVVITDEYENGKVVSSISTSNPSDMPSGGRVVRVDHIKVIGTSPGGNLKTIEISEDSSFTNASPGYDFKAVLVEKLKADITSDLQGWVILQFLVADDGSIGRVAVIRKLGDQIDQDPIDAISNCHAWRPALKNNKAIDDEVYCIVKVTNSVLTVNYAYTLGDLFNK